MKLVILGLSITSSWGNGHATTFRGLVRELCARGHEVLFLERDVPWYAQNRDLPQPPYGRTCLYSSLSELQEQHEDAVKNADWVMVGSYVPEGIAVGDWVQKTAQGGTAFYDIDTPVTLSALARQECEYLSVRQIPRYQRYLSFSGGPALELLEQTYHSPCAQPLYCSVDPSLYYPETQNVLWDLGYMGTYSDDRQPPLEALMLEAARQWPLGRFCVTGPKYPEQLVWPANVTRIAHLPPIKHREWYNSQRFTLNITRADMVRLGWSPSVRLFEAAACGVPLISDYWVGIEAFFSPEEEILISHSHTQTLKALREIPDDERRILGERARARILNAHTAAHRAAELEGYFTP